MSRNSETSDVDPSSPLQKKFAVTIKGINQRWQHRPHLRELFSNSEALSESNGLLLYEGWLGRLGSASQLARLILEQKKTIALALQQENKPEETLAIRQKAHELKREIEGIANELKLFGDSFAREAQQLAKVIEQAD